MPVGAGWCITLVGRFGSSLACTQIAPISPLRFSCFEFNGVARTLALPQGRASHAAISESEYEDLFWEHTRELRSAAQAALREALEEVLSPQLPVPADSPGGVAAAAAAAGVTLPGVARQWAAADAAMAEHATWQLYPGLT